MSERTVDVGRVIAHRIYAPIDRWTESDALDAMFEKPQKAQVVHIKIEAVSLDSRSMAPSLDGPLLAVLGLIVLQPITSTYCACMPRGKLRTVPKRMGHLLQWFGYARAACE